MVSWSLEGRIWPGGAKPVHVTITASKAKLGTFRSSTASSTNSTSSTPHVFNSFICRWNVTPCSRVCNLSTLFCDPRCCDVSLLLPPKKRGRLTTPVFSNCRDTPDPPSTIRSKRRLYVLRPIRALIFENKRWGNNSLTWSKTPSVDAVQGRTSANRQRIWEQVNRLSPRR